MSDDDQQNIVRINGADIHVYYIYQNIAWGVVCLLVVWPLVVVSLLRLLAEYRASGGSSGSSGGRSGRSSRQDDRKGMTRTYVYWAHVTVSAALAALSTTDPSYIYYDDSRWVRDTAINEFAIIQISLGVYYFFSHVETYYVAVKLVAPVLVPRVRNTWMAVNFVVANALLVTLSVSQLAYQSGLCSTFVNVQLALMAPMVWLMSRRVMRQGKVVCSADTPLGKKLKRFRRFTIVSCVLMLASSVVTLPFFIGRFMIDPTRTAADEGWTVRTDKAEYRFDGFQWAFILIYSGILWQVRLFWVSRDHMAEAHHSSTVAPSKTAPAGGRSRGSSAAASAPASTRAHAPSTFTPATPTSSYGSNAAPATAAARSYTDVARGEAWAQSSSQMSSVVLLGGQQTRDARAVSV